MNAPAEITSETFDNLKTGQLVTIKFGSCMVSYAVATMKVGRRSFSKKYGTTTLALDPADGRKVGSMARLRLYKRMSGHVSLAMGDMAAFVTSFEVV